MNSIKLPIEKTKLIIYCSDPRVTAWKLGNFGIFQETHRVLKGNPNQILDDSPSLVTVLYNELKDILGFVKDSELKSIRVFKTGSYKSNKIPIGFLYTAAKNLLALFAETKKKKICFRISSEDRELRQKFYEIAMEINDEFNYGHTFDYDEYDIDFVLKIFKDDNKKLLVTYFYGNKYPNRS